MIDGATPAIRIVSLASCYAGGRSKPRAYEQRKSENVEPKR